MTSFQFNVKSTFLICLYQSKREERVYVIHSACVYIYTTQYYCYKWDRCPRTLIICILLLLLLFTRLRDCTRYDGMEWYAPKFDVITSSPNNVSWSFTYIDR